MSSHRREVKTNKLSDDIKYSGKNKLDSRRSLVNDQGIMGLLLDSNTVVERTDRILSASESITNKLIKDSARYWKAEAQNAQKFINSTSNASSKSSDGSSNRTHDGSNTKVVASAFSSNSAKSAINRLSEGLDNTVKSYDKSMKALSTGISTAIAALSGAILRSSNEVVSRYNTVALRMDSTEKTNQVYDSLANANRQIATELGKAGKNTISPEEYTRAANTVTTYFKRDATVIGALAKATVKMSEVGMDANTEFLRTSNYIYKQSGKNEKSLNKTLSGLYNLAANSDNTTVGDIQSQYTSDLMIGKLLKAQGVNVDPEEFAKNQGAVVAALADQTGLNPEAVKGVFNNLVKEIANATPVSSNLGDLSQKLSFTGMDVFSLQQLGDKLPEFLMKSLMENVKQGDLALDDVLGLGQESKDLAVGLQDTSELELYRKFQENLDKLESGTDLTDVIKQQQVDQATSTKNTLQELSIDSIPPSVATIAQNTSIITGLLSASTFLSGMNFFSGGGGVAGLVGGVKSLSASAASIGVSLPLLAGAGGALWSAVDGLKGASKELASARFGSTSLGSRAASGALSAVAGNGSGLTGALANGAKGALIGTAVAGPIGTLIGGGIGALLGSIGADGIAKVLNPSAESTQSAAESLKNASDSMDESTSKLREILNLNAVLGGHMFKAGMIGHSSGLPNVPNIGGTTKPNGDIDGPSPWTVTAGWHDTSIGYGEHKGVDYGVPVGTKLIAPIDGTVSYVTYNDGTSNPRGGAGKGIIITDSQGRQHLMWHLSQIGVTKGQQVKKGNLVGLSGDSGNSTGPHLHYQINNPSGQDINPNINAAALWGSATSGTMVSSAEDAEDSESVSMKDIYTTSDGRQFRMEYAGSPGFIPRRRLVRGIGSVSLGSGLLTPSNYSGWTASTNAASRNTTLNVDNSSVVSELRTLTAIMSSKIDMLTRVVANKSGSNYSGETFSMPY